MKKNIGFDITFIFILGVLVFIFNLSPEFTAFETRFALFAQQMFYHGITAFPTTYQGPYPDYPALPTILIYFVSLLFGKVTVLTAVLPTAVTSALILVFIYLIGHIQSRAFGAYGVLLAFLCQIFFDKARSISPDQYISLITAIAFYFVYSAEKFKKTTRLFFLPLLFILGFALRGPIGFIIPLAVVSSFYLLNKDIKKLLVITSVSVILFLSCLVALLFLAYQQGGIDFVRQVIQLEALGRLQGRFSYWHYLYYFHQCFGPYAITYPLAFLAIIANFPYFFSPRNDQEILLRYLAAWLAVILVLFSIPIAQNARYLLPIVPAIALIAAYPLAFSIKNPPILIVKKFTLVIFKLFPCVVFLGILTLHLTPLSHRFTLSNAYVGFTAFFSFLISIAVWLENKKIHDENVRNFFITILAVLTLMVVNFGLLIPINYSIEQTRPFVEQVRALQAKQEAPFVFYKIGPDAEDIKFMVNYDEPIQPIFIASEKGLLAYSKRAYFITTLEEFQKIKQPGKLTILFQGKIGHRPCILFQK